MRARIFHSFIPFLLLTLQFQEPNGNLQVQISHLRNAEGHVLVSLFRNGEGYPDKPEKAFRKGKATIVNGRAAVLFTDIPPGQYAVAILHDENDDLKMNKSWIGMPREGYGFSNNVMGLFGPPGLDKASFLLTAGNYKAIEIRTRY